MEGGSVNRISSADRILGADKITVLDNDVISVWVYPARRMIHHRLKAYCFGETLREALNKGTEALDQHKATKWLSDDRNNGALTPEDTDWAEKTWFPKTKIAGWKHWSVIKPEKVIGQMNMSRFVKKFAERGINVQLFSDPDEAFRWLDVIV
jgi:hypothetical protein